MNKRVSTFLVATLLVSLPTTAVGGWIAGERPKERSCKVASKGSYTCGVVAAGKIKLSEVAGLGRITFSPKGKLGAVLQRDEGTVALLDVSRPGKPKVLGRYGTANVSLDGGLAFSNDGQWLFYARQTSDWDMEGIHVLNVSDPENPVLAGYAAGGGAYRVAYHETSDGSEWVVMLDAITGLVVYRFERTTGQLVPVHVDALPALKVGGPASAGIVIEPPAKKGGTTLMHVTTGRTGLQVFDFSDPTAPALLGSWDEVGLAEVAVGQAGKKRLAYAATEYWFNKQIAPEIVVLDVTDPASIEEVRRFSLGGNAQALYDAERLQGMRVHQGLLYVASSSLGLAVLDADSGKVVASARVGGKKNPEARVEVAPYAVDVEVLKGVVYLTDGATGIVSLFEWPNLPLINMEVAKHR